VSSQEKPELQTERIQQCKKTMQKNNAKKSQNAIEIPVFEQKLKRVEWRCTGEFSVDPSAIS
jgi:hypothetical protein